MLPWVSLAVSVAVVAGVLIFYCRKHYRGDKTALIGGIVGSLGATLVFSHALFPPWGRIVSDGDGFRWEETT